MTYPISSKNKFAQAYMASGQMTDTGLSLPNGHFINGQFIQGTGAKRLTSYDPGLAAPIAEFTAGSISDMQAAITAAETGFQIWRKTPPAQRVQVLLNIAKLIRDNLDMLAFIETIDSGKTLGEAEGDVKSSARLFEFYAGIADKLDGRNVNLGDDYTAFTIREPVGITGHIIPWNYPTSTFARGVAPALAAGCSVVAKPAETTPYTALLLAQIFSEAGLPDGVVNVVTGYGHEVGQCLVKDPRINHITFTGSVPTGVGVIQQSAENVPGLTMELGGKSPLIAFEDCDPEQIAEDSCWAIFSNAGQICSAGSRLLVHKSIHQQVLDKLVHKAEAIRSGHGLSGADVGAINSQLHLERVHAHVEAAKKRGCNIVTGGNICTDPTTDKGWFYQPTIIDNLSQEDPAVQEEIFGPVLAVQSFETEEEALTLANGTEFGLVAGVYTQNIGRALRLAKGLDCGQVTINEYWGSSLELPFGGNKKSGYGREKGLEGVDAYLRSKAVSIRCR